MVESASPINPSLPRHARRLRLARLRSTGARVPKVRGPIWQQRGSRTRCGTGTGGSAAGPCPGGCRRVPSAGTRTWSACGLGDVSSSLRGSPAGYCGMGIEYARLLYMTTVFVFSTNSSMGRLKGAMLPPARLWRTGSPPSNAPVATRCDIERGEVPTSRRASGSSHSHVRTTATGVMATVRHRVSHRLPTAACSTGGSRRWTARGKRSPGPSTSCTGPAPERIWPPQPLDQGITGCAFSTLRPRRRSPR